MIDSRFSFISTRGVCLLVEDTFYVVFRNGFLLKKDINGTETLLGKTEYKSKIPHFIMNNRGVQRIFRYQPRAFCYVEKRFLAFGLKRNIYLIDLNENNVTCIKQMSPHMSAPLKLTYIDGMQGFSNEIMFGEYYSNNQKDIVRIHSYNIVKKEWRVVFSFKKGEINHIHGIVTDPYRNLIWVLTGDFDSCSYIWYTNDGFKTLVPFLGGNQIFRTCFLMPIINGIVYATDSPDEDNFLFFVNMEKQIRTIQKLNGSVIYGKDFNGKIILSTTVEPKQYKNIFMNLLSYRLGKGIKYRKSEILYGDENHVEVVFSGKKDFLPMGLFQYGTFSFPSGIIKDDFFVINGIALSKFDNKILKINRSK